MLHVGFLIQSLSNQLDRLTGSTLNTSTSKVAVRCHDDECMLQGLQFACSVRTHNKGFLMMGILSSTSREC